MSDNKLFEIICQHKDTHPSNLNKVFESYGCQTLEAKVPVVEEDVIEELRSIKSDQLQLYANLTLKAASSERALQGRGTKTAKRTVKLVQVNGETLIATGELREEEPVDEDELDDELDAYMKEGARLKALKAKKEAGEQVQANFSPSEFPSLPTTERQAITSIPVSARITPIRGPPVDQTKVIAQKSSKKGKQEPFSEEQLDREMDEYMRESARLRQQKKAIEDAGARAAVHDRMEEDFDVDFDIQSM